MSLPLEMRKSYKAKQNGHFYVDPTGVEIYIYDGCARVRLTRRQLRQALAIMERYELGKDSKA